jgi:hypothetical protein
LVGLGSNIGGAVWLNRPALQHAANDATGLRFGNRIMLSAACDRASGPNPKSGFSSSTIGVAVGGCGGTAACDQMSVADEARLYFNDELSLQTLGVFRFKGAGHEM